MYKVEKLGELYEQGRREVTTCRRIMPVGFFSTKIIFRKNLRPKFENYNTSKNHD